MTTKPGIKSRLSPQRLMEMPAEFRPAAVKLSEIVARYNRIRVAVFVFSTAAGWLALLLFFGLLAGVFRASAFNRVLMGGAWWAVGLTSAGWLFFKLRREKYGMTEAALDAEKASGEAHNTLISAVQFTADRKMRKDPYARLVMEYAARCTGGIPPQTVVSIAPFKKCLVFFSASALVLSGALVLSQTTRTGVFGVLLPGKQPAYISPYRIIEVRPGNVTRTDDGGTFKVEVILEPHGASPPAASVIMLPVEESADSGGAKKKASGERNATAESGKELPLVMAEPTRLVAAFPLPQRTCDYYVVVDGQRYPEAGNGNYRITIKAQAHLASIGLRIDYPDWADADPEIYTSGNGRVGPVPVGSRVTLFVWATRPLSRAELVFDDHAVVELKPASAEEVRKYLGRKPRKTASRCMKGGFEVKREGSYQLFLYDAEGKPGAPLPPWNIIVCKDEPPSVKLTSPSRNRTVIAGQSVQLRLSARDDFRLKRVSFLVRRRKAGEEIVLSGQTAIPREARRGFRFATELKVTPDRYEAGDRIFIRAVASDRNTLEKPVSSKTIQLSVIDPEKKRRALESEITRIDRAIRELIRLQEKARDGTRRAVKAEMPALLHTLMNETSEGQKNLRAKTEGLIATIPAEYAELEMVRLELVKLAAGEMLSAQQMSENLRDSGLDGKSAARPLGLLEAGQDKIIARLKALIGVLELLKKQAAAEKEETAGADLPPETHKRLEKLREELAEKIEEQRKVIAQTAALDKKPVEDLTDEDKNLMKELAASEDDFAKFMKTLHDELEKLPPQDFSDPRLLKETLETYEEVQLASDALTKKTTVLAVPLEQAGLENAESIETNLERWLPNEPDRLKWEMEEPIGDNETPMAELPEELEDIVGDLVEQEEDLMSEADDVTSQWADSLDEGAGWTAMDGPISNYSAKGITGNQLPNSSEIGGRSGEGRTGQASGELVEDTTTGKGGRKTPTRLTPDQFLPGQINDTSDDPAGGATGGGKVGGAGGEGLEGPVPPEVNAQMQRLAGRQADLANRSERVALQLKATGLPSADLEAAVEEMKTLSTEFKDGRYTNISRRRHVVLGHLKAGRSLIGREAAIQADDMPRVPQGLQDEVLGSMTNTDAPVASGYDEVIDGYYKAVLEAGGR